MKSSINAINLIKQSESFKSKPYLCPAGVPTIGYGSTVYENGVHVALMDEPITEKRAEQLLFNQLIHYENAVNRYVKTKLNQNQFDSIVDFTYNVGIGNFQRSTLLKKINKEDFEGASKEFSKWVYANGKKLNGLVKRRELEKELFLKK